MPNSATLSTVGATFLAAGFGAVGFAAGFAGFAGFATGFTTGFATCTRGEHGRTASPEQNR